jgi:hypothetical protein
MPSGLVSNIFAYEFDGKQFVGAYSDIGEWKVGKGAAITSGATEGLGEVGNYKDLAKYTTIGATLFMFSLPQQSPRN